MPIFIKDYNWSDSLHKTVISVPLKGFEASKVDIVLTSEYLKISFPPYIFECFFYKPVSEDESTCVAASGIMQVTAAKQLHEPWPQLMIGNADDKAVTRQIREAALVQFSERARAASAAARANKRANEQLSLQEQMKLEDADRTRIEAAKQAERDSAMRDLEEFRMKQQKLRDEAKRVFREETAASDEAPGIEEAEKPPAAALDIFGPAPEPQRRRPRESVESVLGVRESGRIPVTFTARAFPTPERESQRALEDEWLRKQAERRRLADAVDGAGDLSERERDPVWLRDKGNSLFAAGNFQAAVNAYSHAIEMKSEMHSIYSNRAACHLKLGNFFKALEDSSRALELLQPPVEQNRAARVRAHCRRAAALCGLRAHPEALIELREAARLAPDNAEIAADVERVSLIAQGSDRDDLNDVDD